MTCGVRVRVLLDCSGHAMVTADDQIYVIGGCNDRLVLCEVESRREELNEWQQQPDLVTPRYLALGRVWARTTTCACAWQHTHRPCCMHQRTRNPYVMHHGSSLFSPFAFDHSMVLPPETTVYFLNFISGDGWAGAYSCTLGKCNSL
jgi:hypothetical protein